VNEPVRLDQRRTGCNGLENDAGVGPVKRLLRQEYDRRGERAE
jgi:hypothetical protein